VPGVNLVRLRLDVPLGQGVPAPELPLTTIEQVTAPPPFSSTDSVTVAEVGVIALAATPIVGGPPGVADTVAISADHKFTAVGVSSTGSGTYPRTLI
jgi:hypothetical protein